ncbi:hypothetical protein KIPB_001269 [Kipferlia bialata]|uniref:Uncharacterized protein n=1 Tax=Kipferlia bialata TaxID=797122 RepID=A0A9K3CQC9_9EUKA|nr:hypothetical protein KIPB_001269 [Kipferlia bialata]|eukprot:g1269.t1
MSLRRSRSRTGSSSMSAASVAWGGRDEYLTEEETSVRTDDLLFSHEGYGYGEQSVTETDDLSYGHMQAQFLASQNQFLESSPVVGEARERERQQAEESQARERERERETDAEPSVSTSERRRKKVKRRRRVKRETSQVSSGEGETGREREADVVETDIPDTHVEGEGEREDETDVSVGEREREALRQRERDMWSIAMEGAEQVSSEEESVTVPDASPAHGQYLPVRGQGHTTPVRSAPPGTVVSPSSARLAPDLVSSPFSPVAEQLAVTEACVNARLDDTDQEVQTSLQQIRTGISALAYRFDEGGNPQGHAGAMVVSVLGSISPTDTSDMARRLVSVWTEVEDILTPVIDTATMLTRTFQDLARLAVTGTVIEGQQQTEGQRVMGREEKRQKEEAERVARQFRMLSPSVQNNVIAHNARLRRAMFYAHFGYSSILTFLAAVDTFVRTGRMQITMCSVLDTVALDFPFRAMVDASQCNVKAAIRSMKQLEGLYGIQYLE